MRAELNLLVVVQNVELGESYLGRSLAAYAVAGGNDVEGPHPSRSAGSRAVFAAELAEPLSLFAEVFAGEGACADAARIRLHYAYRLIEL